MIAVHGYAVRSSRAALEPYAFERRDPRPDDVVIDIAFCGICHADLRGAHNAFKRSHYPLVPGHEIVGKVAQVGADVVTYKVGDRVGVGCLVDACGACGACELGEESYCPEMVLTYNGTDRHDGRATQGGYSTRIVVGEKFVVKVPDALDLAAAAPLLCVGVTAWSALRHWRVGGSTKLGVVGLGGLGHLAIKLGRAMGAHVTVFTRTPDKQTDAKRLGAHRVVISTDAAQMDAASGELDLILDTVPHAHDVNPMIATLATNGTLVVLGYMGALEPPVNTVPLILGRRAIAGSVIGGIAETQRMLDFCGEHRIIADIETVAMADVNRAWERMAASDVRYRFVLDLASLAT